MAAMTGPAPSLSCSESAMPRTRPDRARRTGRAAGLALLLAAAIALPQPGRAGEVGIHTAAGGQFNVGVTSLKEARFRTVLKQRYDFSCGSAALASLLSFHYERPTTEETVFSAM
jgi:hypothetical protein